MPILSTHLLSIGYSKNGIQNIVQSDLDLKLISGEMVCLIGPNGTGKSTLLRTLSGLQKPLSGKIQIDKQDLLKLTHTDKAVLIALVLTEKVDVDNATVYDIVSFGRHPYSNWWGNISKNDITSINEAIDLVHLNHKKRSYLSELSDGELQRVMIAKALAQDTPIIMLDEPTAHLDLPNRVEIMLLLHKLAHTTGKAIVLSTHELDMALQAADRIWLMTNDKGIECGVPEDLVLNGHFNNAFQSKAFVFNSANGNFSMNYPMTRKVWVTGDKTRMYWTFRALARAGYMVVPEADFTIKINEKSWLFNDREFLSVGELLSELDKSILT